MGIIGVVAALTIPNLNSSTNDKEKVAKVKKVYSNLQDAYGRAEAVYGPIDEWIINDSNTTAQTTRFGERITEFMKISKVCGMTVNAGCLTKTAENLGHSYLTNLDQSTDCYKFITADGTSMCMQYSSNNLSFWVDIDGSTKGSSVAGKDIFLFVLDTNNRVLTPNKENYTFSNLVSELKSGGVTASTWIIHYDNMDYLKFTDTNGKCPNGTTVTEQHPSCK